MYVEKADGDFRPIEPGVYKAVCFRFVDLGTHEDNGMYGRKVRREVMISWEIPEVRIEIDGENKPAIHNAYYTWSMSEKANLRQALESWRGRPFSAEDLAGPPNGFNTKNLIGVGCQLHIMHNENGKAKLRSIIPLKKDDWPRMENKGLYFQMQKPPLDMDAFNRLSDFHKGKIMASPEWQKINGSATPETHDYARDIDDEIPF